MVHVIDGKTVETVADFIFLGSESLQMVILAMKLRDLEGLLLPSITKITPWKDSYNQPR